MGRVNPAWVCPRLLERVIDTKGARGGHEAGVTMNVRVTVAAGLMVPKSAVPVEIFNARDAISARTSVTVVVPEFRSVTSTSTVRPSGTTRSRS